MSKAALRQLSKYLSESDPKKVYRNSVINPLVHAIDLSESSISEEIRKEVLASDPELDKLLTTENYKKASSIMRAYLIGKTNDPKSSLRLSPDNKNMIIANSFRTISGVLKDASDRVLEYFNSVLANQGSNYVSTVGAGGKLVNLDHIRTVGETRIARDLYRVSGIDPVRFISELQNRSYLTRTKRTEVFDNVVEILSYYQGNQKVFEIKGSVAPDDKNPITGKIASSSVNQREGTEIIKGRVTTFREAVEAAIKDVRWDEQQASDSYKEYVLKTLNNAAVKAGASGTTQALDTAKNSSSDKTRVKSEDSVTTQVVRPQLGIKASQQSQFSLEAIGEYIDARLPERVRQNMGPGSLVYRTGRFANSTRITGVQATAQGYPSIGYSYLRSPYDVFDKNVGKAPWNTPGRDPRALVERSIRDIVKEMAIGRFYMRRT